MCCSIIILIFGEIIIEKSSKMRIDLDKDLLKCQLRVEKCEHCEIEVLSDQLLRHHLLVCPKFPSNQFIIAQNNKSRAVPGSKIDTNSKLLMELSIKLVELESKNKHELDSYSKMFEQKVNQMHDRLNLNEKKCDDLQADLKEYKEKYSELKI
jgi:hypothetical protein